MKIKAAVLYEPNTPMVVETIDLDKPQEGEVVAVGPGKRLDNGSIQDMGVKKGDKILFSKYGGTDVKIDGTDYLIMREDDILCII